MIKRACLTVDTSYEQFICIFIYAKTIVNKLSNGCYTEFCSAFHVLLIDDNVF